MYGTHDYNTEPLAPLGCTVEINVKPTKRETFAPYLVAVFYIGTSQKHYRCHNVWFKYTKSVRIGDTVLFKHKYLTNPTIKTADAIIQASDDLAIALANNIP